MDHKEQIAHLEKLTISKEADFHAATNYFFTISEDVLLMEHSTILESEERQTFFKELLHPVIKQYGEKITIKKLYLMHVEDADFVHGFALLSSSVTVGLYFFDAIKTGMAFVASRTGKSDFFRLTAFEAPPTCDNAIVSSNIDNTYH